MMVMFLFVPISIYEHTQTLNVTRRKPLLVTFDMSRIVTQSEHESTSPAMASKDASPQSNIDTLESLNCNGRGLASSIPSSSSSSTLNSHISPRSSSPASHRAHPPPDSAVPALSSRSPSPLQHHFHHHDPSHAPAASASSPQEKHAVELASGCTICVADISAHPHNAPHRPGSQSETGRESESQGETDSNTSEHRQHVDDIEKSSSQGRRNKRQSTKSVRVVVSRMQGWFPTKLCKRCIYSLNTGKECCNSLQCIFILGYVTIESMLFFANVHFSQWKGNRTLKSQLMPLFDEVNKTLTDLLWQMSAIIRWVSVCSAAPLHCLVFLVSCIWSYVF